MRKFDTKYPVVLVHGMMIKDFKIHRAFRKIRDKLSENHVKVYVTNQDGIGRISTNAEQLKEEINLILEKEGVDKVNIIAHSKGGLDSRYMINKLNMEDHVASLTTLSTPHYGSNISTSLLKMPEWMANFIAFWVNLFYRIFKDKKPDILALAYELTPSFMKRFNSRITNSEKIYYQSYSSNIRGKDLFVMFIPHMYSTYCEEGQTDGIVSVESSKWGEYQGDMGQFNHVEMVGFYGNKKQTDDVSYFYLDIVEGLRKKGF